MRLQLSSFTIAPCNETFLATFFNTSVLFQFSTDLVLFIQFVYDFTPVPAFSIIPGFSTMCCLSEQYDPEVCLGHLRRYTFKELRSATDHFSSKNILGRGGFGIVYKGCLNDGTLVAVKRLKDYDIAGGEIQFQTEVETISLAIHRNLLRLSGFCTTENERLLVYPYMPNGSVASQLRGQ